MLNICTEGSQNKHDIQKSICNTILQELDHKLRFGKVLLHCSKNNLNFRIKTGLVTAAADATVFVWCLGQKQVSKMPHSSRDIQYLVFMLKSDYFGTVHWTLRKFLSTKKCGFKKLWLPTKQKRYFQSFLAPAWRKLFTL